MWAGYSGSLMSCGMSTSVSSRDYQKMTDLLDQREDGPPKLWGSLDGTTARPVSTQVPMATSASTVLHNTEHWPTSLRGMAQ